MSKKNIEESYIDIVEILSTLWKSKKIIIKSTIIFSLVGIIYSLILNNIFTASSIFYPHYQKDNITQGQGLRNLAGLAGIELGSQISEIIPPTLYPNIIKSPEFKIEILDTKLDYNEREITYREYLNETKSKISLKKILLFPISMISSLILKNEFKLENQNINILSLSEEEFELHELLTDKIEIELNENEGFIELSVKDYNPIIASKIAKTANDILQKKIIDFKLKNLNDTYEFIISQVEIAKKNFYILQDSLAIFSDKNRNIKTDLFLNQYSRIESEYLLSKNIFNELALNKEKTAIEVKKNTPIFTVIKPVVIPNEKSEPSRGLIVIIFTFFGFIITSAYTVFKPHIAEISKEIVK